MTTLIAIHDGIPTTTSLAIAEGTKKSHESVIKLVRKYQSDLEEFGRVGFEIQPFETSGGKQEREIAHLNERQSTLLLTYMRNTAIVRAFKKQLVTEFFRMAEDQAKPPPIPSRRGHPKGSSVSPAKHSEQGQLSQRTLDLIKIWEGRFQKEAYNREDLHRESQGEDPLLHLLLALEQDGINIRPFKRYYFVNKYLLQMCWEQLDELTYASKMTMNRQVIVNHGAYI